MDFYVTSIHKKKPKLINNYFDEENLTDMIIMNPRVLT